MSDKLTTEDLCSACAELLEVVTDASEANILTELAEDGDLEGIKLRVDEIKAACEAVLDELVPIQRERHRRAMEEVTRADDWRDARADAEMAERR